MAKLEKQYPEYECIEYDYGDLDHRQYEGVIYASLKFTDEVDISVYFDFKDFLDYHKRKRTPFYKSVETIYGKMKGWGSRYFELIELLQAEDDIDLFELFVQYVEETEEELLEKYETRRERIKEINKRKALLPPVEEKLPEKKEEKKEEKVESVTPVEEEEEEDGVMPYDQDREKFRDLLKVASNDMYEALKTHFFPQIEYFQRRYPSRWKSLTENLEIFFQNFEDEMLHEMLPHLDDSEYREFEIKYNSQKADMSEEEEPPTAR